jgi:hypothetical protein
LFLLPAMRRFLFRTVSQITVNYRGSALSRGAAGKLRGGDRLPWVHGGRSDANNFAVLTSMDWQLHVYGDAAGGLRALADSQKIPLHVFPWNTDTARAGLLRNAAYLVRPDGYIGVADAIGGAAAIGAYLRDNNLRTIT